MDKNIHLALCEPEIPQNVGAAVRLAAGLGCPLDLIEPFGFVFDRRKLRRTALDYYEHAIVCRHAGFRSFDDWRRANGRRLVLLTTRATAHYTAVGYQPGDILLCGNESSGAPPPVHEAADLAVAIRLTPHVRSLNVITALAMVTGEALRQIAPAYHLGDPA